MWKSCVDLNHLTKSFNLDQIINTSSSSSLSTSLAEFKNANFLVNIKNKEMLTTVLTTPVSILTTPPASSSSSVIFTNQNKMLTSEKKIHLDLSFNGCSSGSSGGGGGSSGNSSCNMGRKVVKLTDHDLTVPLTESNQIDLKSIRSSWDILCKLINCKVAFKKQFEDKKYNWIQLAGHVGRFKPGDREGYILKLMEESERSCFIGLLNDALKDYVPKIDKMVFDMDDGKLYTEMQDLLYGFQNPYIMDIKIGIRTFLEDDYMSEKDLKPRNDLYLRMIEVSPDEPTDFEHNAKAITKRRYMTWREKSTCSSTLGFRITAVKKSQVSEKEFYTVREKHEVKKHFKNFTDNNKSTMRKYLKRLMDLKEVLNRSEFFKTHEIIGSSLLFVHDNKQANIWMIDFGKTHPLPKDIQITHNRPWIDGNHEDGYLIGIQSLIDIFQSAIEH